MPHESAALHVTGHALYTDDLVGRTSNVLHAHPVQAPHAHARVTRLEVAAAYDVPGVVRVLTAADVPGINDAGIKHDEPLFPVRGHVLRPRVCWVLGESLEAARRGAAAIEVDYDELPALLTVEEAIAAESFQGARPTMARGDAAAGLARAAHVFEGVTAMAGQEHFYLETHCSLAMIDEAGQVFVQSSTQHPTETQEIVAHVLGVPSHAVTVQCLRMGGGFGGKEMQPHGLAAVAALGATLTGRPVRLRLTRQQDMTMTGKRHGYHATWKVGFDDDGRFTGLEATLTADGGWSLDLSEPVLSRALCHIDNAYWIPDVLVHGRIAKTNKTSQTAFRGFGGPQGMLVIEDIIGRCAPALGIDPAELRRRNFYVDGQATPYGQPVRHPERLVSAWDQVSASAGLDARRAEIAAFNAGAPAHQARAGDHAGEVRHLVQLHDVQPGRRAGARLQGRLGADQPRRHRDGPGAAHQDAPGRGHRARPAAGEGAAGADADRQGAQHLGHRGRPPAPTSTAARSRTPASRSWPGWCRSGPSTPTSRGTSSSRTAYHQRIQLWAAGFYKTEGLSWDLSTMTGSPFKYFAYGAAVAEVEVDGFTGANTTRRVDIVHDVGDSLSPLVDLGQIEGGFVQGAGWLTLEDLRWDETDGKGRGRLTTQAASTYKLPSFSEMPSGVQRRAAGAGPRGRRGLRLQGRRRAAADAGVQRARGAARRVRGVRPAGSAARARLAGHAGGGLLGADRALGREAL